MAASTASMWLTRLGFFVYSVTRAKASARVMRSSATQTFAWLAWYNVISVGAFCKDEAKHAKLDHRRRANGLQVGRQAGQPGAHKGASVRCRAAQGGAGGIS